MPLRFITGRAGSGKTTYCLNSIREKLQQQPVPGAGNNLILLVPEQATFQNEKTLAATAGLDGMMRAQVLSFHRLAWQVLQQVGGGAKIHIAELGKRMLLRQFLENRRAELSVFDTASEQFGFVESLAGTISELKMYQIKVADLNRVIESESENKTGLEETIGSLLTAKLKDLHLVYQDLEEYLTGKYTDPDDYLSLLAEKLPLAPLVKDAEIWIDGFNGFTPQELQVIISLCKTVRMVNITLTLDSGHFAGHFNKTQTTYHKIHKLAAANGITVEKTHLLEQAVPYRFGHTGDIAYLEKYFFDLGAALFNKEVENIKITAAQNHRAEVEAVATEISNLCRQGFRYRDMAVLLRDFGNYDLLIETVFSDYDIPFFMDCKRTVVHYPLVELIRAALETVQSGWNYEPVFRYLKTDLVNVSRDEVNILENYALAYGIKGRKWYDENPWQYKTKGDLNDSNEKLSAELNERRQQESTYLNEMRRRAVAELAIFSDKIKKTTDILDIARAVYELLEELQVAEKISRWAEEATGQGRLDEAQQHNQIWNGIVDILDQLAETIYQPQQQPQPKKTGKSQNLANFIKIIDAGFESMKLGLIPPGLDQVIIGSLERSRNPDLKVVFVPGVGDGVLPAKQVSSGLLNETERQHLKTKGIELAPGAIEKLFDEQFLVYTALTRASHRLYLSYPLADAEGKALRPSPVIKRIKKMFPKLREENADLEAPEIKLSDNHTGLNFTMHPRRALAHLAQQLRHAKEGQKIAPVWWAVYNRLLNDSKWLKGLRLVIEGLFFRNRVSAIKPGLARSLYGNPLRASISRLEKFQTCPFAHFVSYGLRLKERQIYQLSYPDLGQFFHAALEQFAYKLKEQNIDWAQVDKKEIITSTDTIIAGLAPRLQSEILLSSARYRYLTKKFKRIVQRSVTVLAEHARRGKFKLVGLEVAFKPGAGTRPQGRVLPALKITLEDGSVMELAGRIDRVDGCEQNGQYYLRVIDYKSGRAGLSLLEVYYGLKLQLIAYLDVILNYAGELVDEKRVPPVREGVMPAGIFYFQLQDPLLKTAGPLDDKQIEAAILKEFKMKGLLLADLKAFKLMDGQTTAGYSPVVPVAITKAGGDLLKAGLTTGTSATGEQQGDQTKFFYANSSVCTGEQLAALRQHVRGVLAKAGTAIMAGETAISPYRLKEFQSCEYCVFQPVCQFDVQVEGNNYRDLKSVDNQQIWDELSQK